ncbi:VCBS repeat-containing protein [bacterium]|nr:VCBS repeat-containing protein [bacterium]
MQRSRTGLKVLGIIALLFVAAVLWDCLHGWQTAVTYPGTPRAQLNYGQQLPWRVLDSGPLSYVRAVARGDSGVMGGLTTGNFDADPDDELLLIRRHRGHVYEVDGARRTVGIHGNAYLMQVTSWDYDGDGIDEVIPEPMIYDVVKNRASSATGNPPTTTPIIDLSGQLVASPNGLPNLSDEALVGDYDGDGRDELWLYDGATMLVYSTGGTLMAKLSLPGYNLGSAVGDIDGDSLEELVAEAAKPRELVSVGKDQQRTVLGSWSEMDGSNNCADVDGDGRAEFLTGTNGYYTGDGVFVPLQAPPGARRGDMPLTKPVAGDFDGDGDTEIAVVSDGMPFGSGILLYSSNGACEYYEEFGDSVWSVAALNSGGQDYLVVQLTTRLLIYP